MNIHIKHLYVNYGNRQILNDISLSFENRKVTGLIGPNGSGKSTLLKCIYRVLTPVAGQIRIGEQNLSSLSYRESAKLTAVLSQHHISGFDLSVEDVVLMGRMPYKGITESDTAEDYAIARQVMAETGMTDMSELSFSSLSGGEQQRVMLARTFAQKTPCLILDEPTNHLDITYQLQIMDTIRQKRLTVAAAIHDLNIAALYCDKIIALQNGSVIAEGSVKNVLTPQLINELYHIKADIFPRKDGTFAVIYERGHP